MDAPCCLGVVRDGKGLKGVEEKLGELPVYVTAAEGKASVGVVVLSDIFGFNIPNSKYIVDTLAKNGMTAILPNIFFRGEADGCPEEEKAGAAWKANEFAAYGVDELEGKEDHAMKFTQTKQFGDFFAKIASPDFLARTMKEDIPACIAYLKEKHGVSKIGVIGFCYGGMVAEAATKAGLADACVSINGTHTAGATVFKEIMDLEKKPAIFYVCSPNDKFFSEETQKEIEAAGAVAWNSDDFPGKYHMKNYGENSYHGFVVRGDYSNKVLKEVADSAMADTCKFLKSNMT